MRFSPRISPRPSLALVAGLAIAACGSPSDDVLDPNATYTAFGHPFEPAAALPIEAVLAEPGSYLGKAVMIEGQAAECTDASCWMRMTSGDSAEVRILTPDFAVSDTIGNRRIVIHGRLTADTTAATEASPASDKSADSSRHPRPPTYHVRPTGLMVEKVR